MDETRADLTAASLVSLMVDHLDDYSDDLLVVLMASQMAVMKAR